MDGEPSNCPLLPNDGFLNLFPRIYNLDVYRIPRDFSLGDVWSPVTSIRVLFTVLL